MGQAVRHRLRVSFLILFLALVILRPLTTNAQTPLPPPHLGYGIHVAPNVAPDADLVNALGMDWVKIYDPAQASAYPDKRILYRMDLRWPDPSDWTPFKTMIEDTARALIGLHIDAVEVGNEPNLVNEWVRSPNAWEYVQMLRVAYTAIKAGNPNMIVVSAGLAPTGGTADGNAVDDLKFAQEMLDNGAGQWFDAFGYHPYGYNLPPDADPTTNELVFRRTERIYAMLQAHHVYKQVWLTEFGWLRDPAEEGVACSDNDPDFRGFAWLRVSSQRQANYLVQAFQYADQNWPWVGPMFVWNLNWQQIKGIGACNNMRWFGLLKQNNQPTLAFTKLTEMEHRYSDYLPQIELHPDAMTVTVSEACLHRVQIGTFSVDNTGYPAANIALSVSAVNLGSPPVIDVQPKNAHPGDTVTVFANPTGIDSPGQYPVFVNVKGMVNKHPFSQNVQGQVVVSAASNCGS